LRGRGNRLCPFNNQPDCARALGAFNKLLWLQNDLVNRHYQESRQVIQEAA
jgi:hypothetical protein